MKLMKFIGFIFSLVLFSCSFNKPFIKEEKIEEDRTKGLRKIQKIKDGLDVKLIIIPKKETTGIIVEEIMPDGYELIFSEPNYIKKEGNLYKWLIWGKEIGKTEIRYKVKITKRSKDKIKGYLKTIKEGTIEIKDIS